MFRWYIGKASNIEHRTRPRRRVASPHASCSTSSCDSTAYHADIRESFIKSYQKEKFKISLQGLGTGTWRLDGRLMFTNSCKPKNARERIKGILMKCYKRLGLSEAENKTFSEYLKQSANLNVKKDIEPFAEEGHSWSVDGSSDPLPAAHSAPRPTWAWQPSPPFAQCATGCACPAGRGGAARACAVPRPGPSAAALDVYSGPAPQYPHDRTSGSSH